jgi:hypothetical protein
MAVLAIWTSGGDARTHAFPYSMVSVRFIPCAQTVRVNAFYAYMMCRYLGANTLDYVLSVKEMLSGEVN